MSPELAQTIEELSITKKVAKEKGWSWRDETWMQVHDPYTDMTQDQLLVIMSKGDKSIIVTFVKDPTLNDIDPARTKIELIQRYNNFTDVVAYMNKA